MNSVYSGYVVGLREFTDIIQGLKEKVREQLQTRYNELVLLNAMNLLDKTYIEDHRIGELGKIDEGFWAKMVKLNLTCFYSPSRLIGELLLRGNSLKKLAKKYEDKDRLIKNLSYEYLSCIFELANNRVSYRVLLQNVYRESSSKYNFSNELIVYPMGEGVLFLPSGELVEKEMKRGMLSGDFDRYRVACYGDYCVVPDRAHRHKEIKWEDKTLKGFPVGDGIPISLFSVTHTTVNELEEYLKDNLKEILKTVELPDRETRAKKYAHDEVEERYIEWSLESGTNSKESFDEFMLSEAGQEWYGLYEQLDAYYLATLQDLTMENLFESMFEHMPNVRDVLTVENTQGEV